MLDQNYQYCAKNRIDVVDKLRNVKLDKDYCMVSLDVTNMYPSIPHQLIIKALENMYNPDIEIPLNEIIIAISLVLNSMEFQFNQLTYKQHKGCPIGGPLSSLFAEMVIRELEQDVLSKLNVKFFERFVDDAMLIITNSKGVTSVLDAFNAYNKEIQFTIEIEQNNKLNFLDMTLYREQNTITTAWNKKPVASGSILNFYLEHPKTVKIAIIQNLIVRVIALSDRKFHNENINKAFILLLRNKYPIKFIDKYAWAKLSQLAYGNINKVNNNNLRGENKIEIILPFVKQINHKIKTILREK